MGSFITHSTGELWGEYFSLNLFPKSLELSPASPKKHPEIQDRCEQRGKVGLLVWSLGDGGEEAQGGERPR